MIKAIETVYNGYRFRSRLEARWAVFFDTLGIKYEYEKEGYQLGRYRYLPDFWLPDFDCWLEVKGNPSPESTGKMKALARLSGKLVFEFSGCIPPESELVIEYDLPDVISRNFGLYHAPDGESDGSIAFGVCPSCEEVCIGWHGGHAVFTTNAIYEIYKGNCPGGSPFYRESAHPRIKAAFIAARQARFEHGENGR